MFSGKSEELMRRLRRVGYARKHAILVKPAIDDRYSVDEVVGYGTGEFKRATEAFEKALGSEPSNSNYALWLGRSYGRRAATARAPLI
jgi:hypothetical protein